MSSDFFASILQSTHVKLCVHIVPPEVRKRSMKFTSDTVLSSAKDLILRNFSKEHALTRPKKRDLKETPRHCGALFFGKKMYH